MLAILLFFEWKFAVDFLLWVVDAEIGQIIREDERVVQSLITQTVAIVLFTFFAIILQW